MKYIHKGPDAAIVEAVRMGEDDGGNDQGNVGGANRRGGHRPNGRGNLRQPPQRNAAARGRGAQNAMQDEMVLRVHEEDEETY